MLLLLQSQTDGVVAQLVEQRTENPCVTGSIPVDATKGHEFVTFFYFVMGLKITRLYDLNSLSNSGFRSLVYSRIILSGVRK